MKMFTCLFATLIAIISFAQQKDFHNWAPTPPMGWNSWDCYGPTVTEAEVKSNADFMADNLKQYGWEYIVVDIRWYIENDKAGGYNQNDAKYVLDKYGRYQPAVNRFPSAANGKGFKPLADYIHSKGLKFGIHLMRGIPKVAVDKKLVIKGTKITADKIYSPENQCPWLKDNYTIIPDKKGAQEYYNSLFELYAQWGLDFIKIDDLSRPYFSGEIEMIRKAIDKCGREILLSTSPGETPIANASHVKNHANMWRVIDDFWDHWKELKMHFDIFNRWSEHITYGAYPDGDMLPMGHISIRAERGKDHISNFTKDEVYTMMALWCINRSPLMFGGNLPTSDEFSISLLKNNALLDVLKYSKNNRQLFRTQTTAAWIADDTKSGDKYLAVFNIDDTKEPAPPASAKIPVDLKYVGIMGDCQITDLWNEKIVGVFNNEFTPEINRHGAGLYRIKKIEKVNSSK